MRNPLLNMVFDSFFPPVCFGCGVLGADLCANCLEKMHPSDDRCVLCGKAQSLGVGCTCTLSIHLESPISLWKYEKPVSQLIKVCKYSDKPKAAILLLQFLRPKQLAKMIRLVKKCKNPLLIPVPPHKDRLQERGFDQARLIAEALSLIIKAPITKKGTVLRVSKTQPQAKLKLKEDRLKNVLGVFYVAKPKELVDRTAILVDDVLTTGSTLVSLAQTVYPHTGLKTQGIVLAHET